MADLLAAEGLVKSYGSTQVLDGTSLVVETGDVYALIGPNGAGKTTLVQCLTGATTPDAGRVSVFGDRPTEADASRIGYLPQDFEPHPRLTAQELLEYYAEMYRETRTVDDVLTAVGVGDVTDTRYENLSGGQKRRVCVATTLLPDPDLLFLDEPTTGIDPAGRQQLWSLIETLAGDGTSVCLTTHYMAEAEYLADRVGLLADGAIVDSGPPAALVDEYGGSARLEIDLIQPTDRNPLADVALPTSVDGNVVVVEDVTPDDLGTVIDALAATGVDYRDVTWSQPSLKDVYLALADGTTTGDGSAQISEAVT